MATTVATPIDIIRDAARPFAGAAEDYSPLLDMIGDAHFVLVGEATHGTHEFYAARAELTLRLIRERGFNAVAVEADWPDAYRVNRYVRGAGDARDARDALAGFKRFPAWMWRNTVVLDFVERLQEHNRGRAPGEQVGFYGLDLYSLYTSVDQVIRYLERMDPAAAQRAKERYGCLEPYSEEPQHYGYASSFGLSPSCEGEVIAQLEELRQKAADDVRRDGYVASDEFFYAEQNARLAKNAAAYYRSMFAGRDESWNLRDRHMAETLDALSRHLSAQGQRARIVVWEHNSHIGDARATEMSRFGELNVGQLARERYGRDAVLIGLTTFSGTVSAASKWDGPVERKCVRPALARSAESLFHAAGIPDFQLLSRPGGETADVLREPRLERAIGVIYRPETEQLSHYFMCRPADQFDAIIHIDRTSAVEPLEQTPEWQNPEPETYPTGL